MALVMIGAVAICGVAWGQETGDLLSQARDLVQQASGAAGNKPGDVERIQLLTRAVQLAQQAPQHNLKGHRVLAIQDLRVAITLLRDGDPQAQLAGYIKNATSELSAAIALAEKNDAAQLPRSPGAPAAAPPIAPATNAPPIVPLPPATNAPPVTSAGADGPAHDFVFSNALPPGVTEEMEKDFLARYEAALKTAKASKDEKGVEPYLALYAMDPAVDVKGREAFKSMALMGLALDSMGKSPSYAFAPVTKSEKGQKEEPTPLGGKMYVSYLPEVAVLKITFATSAGDEMVPKASEKPLCIQNGKLMLIGIKEVPGLVPPPMDDPAENYGLMPNHRAALGKDEDSDEFNSLADFVGNLKQEGVKVVASGQTDFTFCAVCRVHPNLLVFAFASRPGKENYFDTVQVTDAQGNQVNVEKKDITLVEEKEPGIDGKAIVDVSGSVFKLMVGYAGTLHVEAKFWEDDEKHPSTFETAVEWK